MIDASKGIIAYILKRISLYTALVYIIFLAWITLAFLIKQVTRNYLDFGEGNYLYIAWRMLNGEFPYKEILAPHPPVIFLWGALLMKISHSIIFIRSINLILYILSNILLYRIIVKIFKNPLLALFSCVFAFIFPISVFWWPTFTMELPVRLLVMLLLNIVLPLKELNDRKINSLVVISTVMIFTKYYTLPFIVLTALYLLVTKKKYGIRYLTLLIAICLLIFFGLQWFSNGTFLTDTFLIRKNIPLKSGNDIYFSVINIVLIYVPFAVVNLLLSFMYLTKKNYSYALFFMMPVIFFCNVFITFYEGAFNYIYFPIESLLIVGLFYFILYPNKQVLFQGTKSGIKIAMYGGAIVCLFSIIYFIQTFVPRFKITVYKPDISNTEKTVRYIQKNSTSAQSILSPPYLAYLAQRKIAFNYSDSFMWLMVYLTRKYEWDRSLKLVGSIKNDIMNKKIPIVIVDWQLGLIKEIQSALDNGYTFKEKIYYEVNQSQQTSIYVP